MKCSLAVLGLLVVIASADVYWALPGKVEASMNVVLPHAPYAISEEAQRLHDTLLVADLHADTLLWKRDLTKQSSIGHIDMPSIWYASIMLPSAPTTTAPSLCQWIPASWPSLPILCLWWDSQKKRFAR